MLEGQSGEACLCSSEVPLRRAAPESLPGCAELLRGASLRPVVAGVPAQHPRLAHKFADVVLHSLTGGGADSPVMHTCRQAAAEDRVWICLSMICWSLMSIPCRLHSCIEAHLVALVGLRLSHRWRRRRCYAYNARPAPGRCRRASHALCVDGLLHAAEDALQPLRDHVAHPLNRLSATAAECG